MARCALCCTRIARLTRPTEILGREAGSPAYRDFDKGQSRLAPWPGFRASQMFGDIEGREPKEELGIKWLLSCQEPIFFDDRLLATLGAPR